MFSALAMVALALTLTQPGRIIEESELPPPGERPAQTAPESTAPARETPESPAPEKPSERRAPEASEGDTAPDAGEQTQGTQEEARTGGRVMAFWMLSPTQPNP